ncbi:PLP-dependent aminotransferase family protein [Kushneria marisflavi]|uniref:GntR family transcriptional regulator n=1 Tax=Kushneria marisflavi TaxID=157779 RepID=A0A240UPA0_9GAMM|nr:PLP-dependent aminotransferase family protein [Kushneria marisflavi]ART63311.1 GntR family transcriptional regulator [Kushneria marisflavi]RKD84348.1 GntR family transcriptional regulator/MocR family aminotransferase [Kushneria marisflavi]
MQRSVEEALRDIETAWQRQPDRLSKQVRLEQVLTTLIEQQWVDGQRLPAHRHICQRLGVARNTLAGVIELLQSRHLLATQHGRGSWSRRPGVSPTMTQDSPLALSQRAHRILGTSGASPIQSGAFVPGIPDIARFPMRRWRTLYATLTVPQNALLLSYSSGGYGPLKREIAHFLRRGRGIECALEQIIITDGTHHGLELCALALADHGDRVVMDSPCYWGARNVFQATGLGIEQCRWLPGNGYGEMSAVTPAPRLLYLTGARHYPLSVPMPIEDKRALVEHLSPDIVIEDDYEFFEMGHRELLFSPEDGHTILAGSFSKLMFPGLRLGYLVVPRALSGALNKVRSEVFREGRMLDQAVLAKFMADGDLDRWCRRIHRDYLQRQQTLHDLLAGLPGVIDISPPAGTITLCVTLSCDIDDVRLSRYLLNHYRLVVKPLSPVCADDDPRRGLVLGIGMVEGDTLERLGRQLAEGIRRFIEGR